MRLRTCADNQPFPAFVPDLRFPAPFSSLNINFMVCAADLWSADTTEEMNLVQHSGFQYKAGVGVGTSPVPSPALAPDSPPSRHPESTLQSDSTDAAIGSDVFQALLPRPSLRNPWEGPSVSGRPRTSPVEVSH